MNKLRFKTYFYFQSVEPCASVVAEWFRNPFYYNLFYWSQQRAVDGTL